MIQDIVAKIGQLGFDSVVEYQRWHHLKPDNVAGPITTAHVNQPRCGTPDIQPADGPSRASWPRTCMEVTVAYQLSRLHINQTSIDRAWLAALEKWNAACGIAMRVEGTLRDASIWATAGPLRGSTLAWSFLPSGNCRDRIEQRYDTTERWDEEKLAKVILHEIGHAIGLEHSQRRDDIMYPSIQSTPLDDYLSPNDIRRVVDFYGPPEGPPPPPGPEPVAVITIDRPLPAGTYEVR